MNGKAKNKTLIIPMDKVHERAAAVALGVFIHTISNVIDECNKIN